jgi:hypothetical protein
MGKKDVMVLEGRAEGGGDGGVLLEGPPEGGLEHVLIVDVGVGVDGQGESAEEGEEGGGGKRGGGAEWRR